MSNEISDSVLEALDKVKSLEIDIKPDEDPKHYMAIAHLYAAKAQPKDISFILGLTLEEVQTVILLPRIRSLIGELQKREFSRDPIGHFRALLPDAIELDRQIMQDPKEKTSNRLKASHNIQDRAMGKAQQHVTIQTSTMGQLFDRLESLERTHKQRVIEAESKEVGDNIEEAEIVESMTRKNKWKQWAEENI